MLKWKNFFFVKSNFTELSRPKVNSIMKNINDQNVLPNIVEIAAGYTINTSPGPSVATSSILDPDM
jgi:hypothetical protein